MRANEINNRPLHPREVAILLALWAMGPLLGHEVWDAVMWDIKRIDQRLEMMKAAGFVDRDKDSWHRWRITKQGREVVRKIIMDSLNLMDDGRPFGDTRLGKAYCHLTENSDNKVLELIERLKGGEA